MKKKIYCSNRGFNSVAPENTLPAFASAVSLGAEEIEFDLWHTADGEIVVCHDPTVDRTTDGPGSINEMTADEVMARFPCQYLVVRDRKVIAPDRHAVQVSVFGRKEGEERVSSPEIDFPVLERIGGGDAFDGALLHALTEGEPLGEAVMFAVAVFALKHTVKGDTFTLCREDVLRYRHRLEGTI